MGRGTDVKVPGARLLAVMILLAAGPLARAQDGKLPDAGEPLLRLEAGGPAGDVTALAFAPDGETLYAAGWDKVVRVWQRDPKTGRFVAQRTAYRVPIGPGLSGAINALALSPDGKWLAVGGLGVFRGQSGFRLPGLIVPREALTPDMREDEGTIFVFATAKPGHVRPLRGHRGPILGLTFVSATGNAPPVLVSVARGWSEADQRYTGEVRAWDVDRSAALAQLAELPDPGGKLPGLTAWRTGPGANQIQVALAWEDNDFKKPGKLRVWDVAQKRIVNSAIAEGHFNITAAYLGPNRLLTGSLQNDGNGRLQTWQVPAGDAVAAGPQAALFPYEQDSKTILIPRALGLVASAGDGRYDHAAVVLRVEPAKEYRLQLVPLAAPGTFTVNDALPLWDRATRLPVLATAPRGSAVAVAGAPDHAIRVYSVADLLKNKPRPQLLHSIGARLGQAALVVKGAGKQASLGLILSEDTKAAPGAAPRPPRAGDLLLDFSGRRLTSTLDGWKLFTPAPGGWQADRRADAPSQIEVTSPAGQGTVIKIDADRVITDYALLPPRPPLHVPLLAVASTKGNEPELAIYHAGTGDPLCQLTGHLGPIDSVAFSDDGRFLVSAGSDQTVCLWTLIDLEPFVGKQGQLRGVIVQAAANGGLVVTQVAADSPAQGKLKKSDAIRGVVRSGQLRAIASAPDFYETMLREVPGKEATLRLGDGHDVAVPVSQAAQERTPLLVLFVTRGERAETREWLAWNPLGPYDSSTPKMARAFGWHFNTGKAEEPVEFTPADEDRGQERREGLLPYLVARGSLVQGLKEWEAQKKAKPLPPPLMVLDIDGMERQQVRRPRTAIRLRVDGIPMDHVHEVLWSVDDGPWRPFTEATLEDRSADYAEPIDWKRGPHKVRAVLRTRETVPQEFFAAESAVSYVPPPPVVQPLGPATKAAAAKSLVTDRGIFSLEATVEPGLPDDKLTVQVYHQNILVDSPVPKDGAVRRDIKLLAGANHIEVIAVHAGALPATKEAETARLNLDVVYTPAKAPNVVPPPLIALKGIVPLIGGKEAAALQSIHPGKAVIVNVPQVRLVGSIKAVRELTVARRQAPPDAWADLAKFRPSTANDFTIDEPLTLRPGVQKVTVRARAAGSDEAEQSVSVEYRPPLPRLELAALPAGPMFYDEGKGAPEIRFGGPVILPHDPAPAAVKATATLLVNGQELPAAIDLKALTWTASARLQPGANRVQVRVRNDWHEATYSDLQLSYLRPPHGLRANVPAVTKDKVLDLVAHVESPLPLTKKSVHGMVGSRDLTEIEVTPPAEGSTWQIHVRVPLEPGSNEIRLDLANAEGACRAPGSWTVTYVPPVPPAPPPQVVFLEPAAQAGLSEYALLVTRPDLPVRFHVQSPAPLKRVALTMSAEGKVGNALTFDLASVEKKDGAYELTGQAELKLPPGLTLVRIEAEHTAGSGQSPDLLVNFVPPPVQLVLDSLQPQDDGAAAARVVEKADGTLMCDPVGKARLWLHGRVKWRQADAALAQKQTLNVYVNGAHQWRGVLGAAGSNPLERAFKADVVLGQAKGNEVEVELPGLKLPEHQPRRFRVDCTQPEPERWLHVQIISPDEANIGKLVGQVLDTLQGSDYVPAKESFKRPGFAQARLYRPLADEDLDEHNVVSQLLRIKRRIEERARDGWPNDVVLIYFVGGEVVDDQGRFVSLVHGTLHRPLITRQRLEQAFADTLGVKVLLLDVVRDKTGAAIASEQMRREVAQWLESPTRHAWMRAAWLDPGARPPEARLLTALQQTLPGSESLGDLTTGIEEHYRKLGTQYGAVRADSFLPPALRELHLKGGR
jgi:WD40 repeat protein